MHLVSSNNGVVYKALLVQGKGRLILEDLFKNYLLQLQYLCICQQRDYSDLFKGHGPISPGVRAYGLSYSWGLVQVRDKARGGNGGVGEGGLKSLRALYLINQNVNVIDDLLCDMIDRKIAIILITRQKHCCR